MSDLSPGHAIRAVVRGPDGPVPITARTTGVPGLIANPAPAAPEEWGVTHYRSGLSLGFWTSDPELAIRFAHAVANLADWTLSGDEVREAVGRTGTRIREIGYALGLDYIADQASDYRDITS